MLLYSFHIYSWSTSLTNDVYKWNRSFIYSSDNEHRKLVIVAWHKVFHPLHEGGLGIRYLTHIHNVAIIKFSWDSITSSPHWVILLRGRIFQKHGHIRYHINSSIWTALKVKLTTIYEYNKWQLGKSNKINFLMDTWLEDSLIYARNIDEEKKSHPHTTANHFI